MKIPNIRIPLSFEVNFQIALILLPKTLEKDLRGRGRVNSLKKWYIFKIFLRIQIVLIYLMNFYNNGIFEQYIPKFLSTAPEIVKSPERLRQIVVLRCT